MKKVLKSIICLVLCMIMVFPTCVASSAASLPAPKNLKATNVTTKSFKLTWDKVSGASGYNVAKYNTTTKTWTVIASTKATSYNVSGLYSVAKNTYKVRAYKGTTKGKYTDSIKIVTLPSKVTGVKQSACTTNSVTIKWSSVKRVTGYEIFYYKESKSTWVSLGRVTATTTKLKNLSPGQVCSFKIAGYYKNGSSYVTGDQSTTLKAVAKPDTVQNLAASQIESGKTKLTWDKTTGTVKYQVYRYDTDTWSKVATVSGTSYTASCSGSTEKFKVRAVASTSAYTANGLFSGVVTASADNSTVADEPEKENTDTTGIATPSNLTLSAVSGQGYVTVAWGKVSGASGYEVYHYNSNDGTWSKVKSTTSTSYKYTVSETDTYYFKVRAYGKVNGKTTYSSFTSPKAVEYRSNKNSDNLTIASLEKGGVLGYLYDAEGNYFYTSSDPWQRVAGFTPIYDACAPLAIMFYDTIRLKFNADGLDWMIQLWKGQYGWVFIGAEIGVYTQLPGVSATQFYFCADDDHLLNMSMVVKNNGKVIINRPYGEYWWCTGFVPGILPGAILGKIAGDADTSSLEMVMRITTKSQDMLKALCGALEGEGFKNGSGYVTTGMDVIIYWK